MGAGNAEAKVEMGQVNVCKLHQKEVTLCDNKGLFFPNEKINIALGNAGCRDIHASTYTQVIS